MTGAGSDIAQAYREARYKDAIDLFLQANRLDPHPELIYNVGQAYEKLGDVPVDFMSDVDTTGGNSGSAVLNSQGELVGLLFDGTLETVASDFLFDTEKTRSIQVDSRYLLWVWDAVEGAKNLLDEVGIK